MKRLLPLLCAVCCALTMFSQVPQAFSYQAIARDVDGKPISDAEVDVNVKIVQNGTTVFSETHDNLTTNAFGLFTLQVGSVNTSDFAVIDWTLGNFSLRVTLSGALDIETITPILSVPYALLANEVVNEHQTLAIIGNQLSIEGGNTVALPTGTTYSAGNGISITGNTISSTDQDADPANEIQQLSLNGAQLSLSNGGGAVSLPTGTTYTASTGIAINGNVISNTGDLSNTNEIQQLSVAGNQLTLSNGGGSVTLPTGTTYTAGNGIAINANTISATDNSATNEIQQLTLNGTQLALSNGGGSVTLPTGTTYTAGNGIAINANTISATDNSATNEIQQLAYNANNNQLSISGTGGNAVTLPVSQWQNTTGGIYYDAGKVGVGTSDLTSSVQTLVVKDGIMVKDGQQGDRWNVETNTNGSVLSQTTDTNGGVRIEQGYDPSDDFTFFKIQSPLGGANIESTSFGGDWFYVTDDQDKARADLGYSPLSGASYLNVYGPDTTGGVRIVNDAMNDSYVIIKDPQNIDVARIGQGMYGAFITTSQDGQTDDAGILSNKDGSRGFFINDDNGTQRMQATLNENDVEFMMLHGANGEARVILGPSSFQAGNGGAVSVSNSIGSVKGSLSSGAVDDGGHLGLWDYDGPIGAEICTKSTNGNPCVSLFNNGLYAARMYLGSDGKGSFALIDNNAFAARMYVNASGIGNLELNGVKSFVIPYPTLPEKELVYACIEGPEAAVYLRGTATLVNGEATVIFPETFTLVANTEGMTVQMMPLSADSKGLAAVERNAEGLKVKELFNGAGNYQFDWEVKAVRKGFENFEVVRDKRKIEK